MADIVQLDVPVFIRLLELAREEIKDDADIHDVAEIVIKMSGQGPVTMNNYKEIVSFMQKQGSETNEDHAEDPNDPVNYGEYDREGDMAKDDLRTIDSAARELYDILKSDENLPEWVQAKITKAADYIDTVRDYLKANKEVESTDVDELDRIKQLGGIQ
jgi:hypothetical protein